jgi:electron transport complex protein RnfC
MRVFREISPGGAVKVPLAFEPPFPVIEALPVGQVVHRGAVISALSSAYPASLAPISGTVGPPTSVRLTTGQDAPAISLEPLSEGEGVSPTPPGDGEARLAKLVKEVQAGDLSKWTDQLRLAGVWADRWTSPDLLGQLHQCLKRPVDTVICNALDFDDTLRLQQAVACDKALEIVTAIAALAALTSATRALFVYASNGDDSCRRAIDRWSSKTGVRTQAIRNDYPQANPTLLLRSVVGRHLRPGSLPAEAGVLLLDAVAAAAVGRYLLYGEPLLRTPVAITDMRSSATTRTHFLNVPIGTQADDMLRAAGVSPGGFELRGGSPLREVRLNGDCVIAAGGEAALYLLAPQTPANPDPCIRCGWCASNCPVRVQPAGLLEAAQTGDPFAAEHFGLDACIECGVCSYVCPSHLPLLPAIRSLRTYASVVR